MSANPKTVAIIGAGMTGAMCARRLCDQGFSVVVYEKSRGVGGRIATRRVGENLAFDHGAQGDAPEDDSYRRYLLRHEQQGYVAKWTNDKKTPGSLIGAPRANSHLRNDLEGIEIRNGSRVIDIGRSGAKWTIETEDGAAASYDFVVVTAPAPQTFDLIGDIDIRFSAIKNVEMAPCWSVMVALESPLDGEDKAQEFSSNEIDRIVLNSSKPGRCDSPQCWVIHASAEWSVHHLEKNADEIPEHLLAALPAPLAPLRTAQALYRRAHRWRYARTQKPLRAPIISSADGALIAAGDWCLGDRIEHAFLSGRAAADNIINAAG